jgi:hypothetical protein
MGFECLVGSLMVSLVGEWICFVAWVGSLKVKIFWFAGYL